MWVAYWAASESLDFADQWLLVDGRLRALQRPSNPGTLPTLSGIKERRSCTHNFHPLLFAFHFRKIHFFHNFALHSTHSHTPLTQTHTHTLDKPMNSARGRVLDQSGTCFTTMWDRLTKTTETAKRKGEKRILEKWEAHWDKSWRRLRQKRARTENKRENEMTNFTEENLEHCLQSQVSCVCNCEGQCTGHCSAIKVVALTVLVCSSYCQNWVCVCVSVSLTGQNPTKPKNVWKQASLLPQSHTNMYVYDWHSCCMTVSWNIYEGAWTEQL